MSAASGNDVSVNYATTAGTATPGGDYRAASGTLTIRAGQTSGTIRMHVVGDPFLERDEIMYVNLSKPSGAFVSVGQAGGSSGTTTRRFG
jgi:fibronectin-binding autotransporter adhesin